MSAASLTAALLREVSATMCLAMPPKGPTKDPQPLQCLLLPSGHGLPMSHATDSPRPRRPILVL